MASGGPRGSEEATLPPCLLPPVLKGGPTDAMNCQGCRLQRGLPGVPAARPQRFLWEEQHLPPWVPRRAREALHTHDLTRLMPRAVSVTRLVLPARRTLS